MMLETTRLELVAMSAEELRLLTENIGALEQVLNFTYKGEPLVGHFANFLRAQAGKVAADPANYAFLTFWLLIRKQDRVAVGTAAFKNLPGAARETEIGYGLGEQHRGYGYMTEAVAAICGWALGQPAVCRVIAETEPGNEPSEHVLERCGFAKYKIVDGNTWWQLCADAR